MHPRSSNHLNFVRMASAALFLGLAFIGFRAGAAASNTQTSGALTQIAPAGADRPASVPEHFVITPFGYFDPSCVRTLAAGEHVMQGGRVQHADGIVESQPLACSQPHFLHTGVRVEANSAHAISAKANPTINGWIESASINTGSESQAYSSMNATWIVPRNPNANDGQTVYYFPGFEDIGNVQSILQPVLGYNQGAWTIASWNCCINGVTTNSAPMQVNPGDTIYGNVTPNCGAGTLSCNTWNVSTQDNNTGQITALTNTPSEGQVFNWAFGGVLEVYGINSCDDLPPDGQTTYDQINVYDQNDNLINSPQWQTSVNGNENPSCNYQVNTTPQTVTVVY